MNNGQISFENATLCFKNFSGKESQFNAAGKRNFCVVIKDENVANALIEDGWNVKHFRPRDPDEIPDAYLQVSLSFEHFPPKIVLISSAGKEIMTEDTIDVLDWAEIENVDLIVRPYSWTALGKSGVKAYLKAMYVTLVEDEFEKKYSDVSMNN